MPLFERIAPEEDWEVLAALEGMTNDRLRQEAGEIALVPRARWRTGPGWSPVMAAFTHPPPKGSRFSDGSYGVYYAATDLPTAICERAFHLGRFYANTADPQHSEVMRVYVGGIAGTFHDLRRDHAEHHDPDPATYPHSQALARTLRNGHHASDGIIYRSVRRPGGECVAVFWPDRVGLPRQERRLVFHWDGSAITGYGDAASGEGVAMPGCRGG